MNTITEAERTRLVAAAKSAITLDDNPGALGWRTRKPACRRAGERENSLQSFKVSLLQFRITYDIILL